MPRNHSSRNYLAAGLHHPDMPRIVTHFNNVCHIFKQKSFYCSNRMRCKIVSWFGLILSSLSPTHPNTHTPTHTLPHTQSHTHTHTFSVYDQANTQDHSLLNSHIMFTVQVSSTHTLSHFLWDTSTILSFSFNSTYLILTHKISLSLALFALTRSQSL